MRHFTLFRMEAAYSIRQEMEDALERLNPCLGDMGKTRFQGKDLLLFLRDSDVMYFRMVSNDDSFG